MVDQRGKKNSNYRHGMNGHPVWYIWKGIRQRCNNPRNKDYLDYGGRGITVCDEWNKSFHSFMEDMLPTWKKGLTLERVNNNEGYSRENCTWVTRKEQSYNRRSNILVEYRGEKMNLTEWSKKLGVREGLLHDRYRLGWEPEHILTAPKFTSKKKRLSMDRLLEMEHDTIIF